MGSYRKRDMDVEREIAKFLDKYLYSNPIFTKGSYIPPDPKPGGYNLCL